MSWLGQLVGETAGAIFPGAKAIVTKLVDRAVVAVVNAGRVRSHLGDEDEAILCPIHLLPMKLLPIANSSGLLRLPQIRRTSDRDNAMTNAYQHKPPASTGQRRDTRSAGFATSLQVKSIFTSLYIQERLAHN